MSHLWLVGMMGAGKTAVGGVLAHRIGRPLVDTDAVIVAKARSTVADLWRRQGEDAFRDEEAEAVAGAAGGPEAVIATGGGAVLRPGNVAIMRGSGTVVWLRAEVAELARRLGRGKGRPLLEDRTAGRLDELAERRAPLYARAAHLIIDAARPPEVVADEVLSRWR